MEKGEIRRLALQKRESLGMDERRKKNALIARRLCSLAIFRKSRNILMYYSVKGEVETLEIMQKWMRQKNFYLPRLTSGDSFIALRFSSFKELQKNAYGILEPGLKKATPPLKPQLDLIIMPGVAFDRRGHRIGMGKGFYDRFLSHQKGALRVALAFSEQVLDRVPSKPYDESVDMIVTDCEVIRCKESP